MCKIICFSKVLVYRWLAGAPQVFGRNLGAPLRPKSRPLPSPKRGNQGRKAGPKGEAVLPLRELEGLRRCILNLPNTYGVPANHLYMGNPFVRAQIPPVLYNVFHLLKPKPQLLSIRVDNQFTIFGNAVYFAFKGGFAPLKLIGLLVTVQGYGVSFI